LWSIVSRIIINRPSEGQGVGKGGGTKWVRLKFVSEQPQSTNSRPLGKSDPGCPKSGKTGGYKFYEDRRLSWVTGPGGSKNFENRQEGDSPETEK